MHPQTGGLLFPDRIMKKRPFTKPATTHEEQVALLQKRGMTIHDIQNTYFCLKHIHYYRLSAYWLPFEINGSSHDFRPGTNFTTVLELYNFDRELRLLVLDALERIEISMRTQWTYHMAHRHGPHSHLDHTLAVDRKWYQQNLESVAKEVKRADEVFIRHLKSAYQEHLPPIWATSEVISLGMLSKLYTNLKPMSTRGAIAGVYDLDEELLGSWLHHLTHIRNICAHHSRLWNREFSNIPMRPKNKPSLLFGEFVQNSRKLYNTLIILLYCMDIVAPEHSWRQKLKILLQNQHVSLKSMGFPDNWKQCAIWAKK